MGAGQSYKPWRNYSRTFKLAMLAWDDGGIAKPTPLANLLADDGKVTSDEYFHFLAEATTDPAPGLIGWSASGPHRYPLLFALKYLLSRANLGMLTTSISQIVSAYESSGYVGDEDQTAFVKIATQTFPEMEGERQAKESIRVISQISYLNSDRTSVTVSLAPEDIIEIFDQLDPIRGYRLSDGDKEIERVSSLFPSAIAGIDFDYGHTVVSDTEEAGFAEWGRVKKTHLKIERNSKLRSAFFLANPASVCDFCGDDTHAIYPWADRVLDIHHLLPLCSGARTSLTGTVLSDLVANCPTCHRAVHRFYETWLKANGRRDFDDAAHARAVYAEAKSNLGA